MQNGSVDEVDGNGIHTEVDEMVIGGKARNMHRDEMAKLNAIGWGNKTHCGEPCLSAIAESGLRSSRIALRPQVLNDTMSALLIGLREPLYRWKAFYS